MARAMFKKKHLTPFGKGQGHNKAVQWPFGKGPLWLGTFCQGSQAVQSQCFLANVFGYLHVAGFPFVKE